MFVSAKWPTFMAITIPPLPGVGAGQAMISAVSRSSSSRPRGALRCVERCCPSAAPPLSRHVLPQDLPGAIKQLTDQELERLVEVAVAEQDRRFGKLSVRHAPSPSKRRRLTASASLTPSKVNASARHFQSWRQNIKNCATIWPVQGGCAEWQSNQRQTRHCLSALKRPSTETADPLG